MYQSRYSCHYNLNCSVANIAPPSITFSGGTAANPATVSHTGGTQTNICATLATSEETFDEGSVVAYPNPFTDIVAVDFTNLNSNAKATIFDVTGKSLLTFELDTQNNTMNLSSLHSGLYFCKLDSNNLTKTITLVKK
jgi:Secretion system C-terminal sorting domain